MIWFIIGILPFVLFALYLAVDDPMFVVQLVLFIALVSGSALLAVYGGWEMNWFEHCGNFWQSYDCR